MNKMILPIFLMIMSFSYSQKKAVDLLVYNARIYTVDSLFSVQESMAIKGGKIIAIGTTAILKNGFTADSLLDAGNAFIYPGFIDAHAHFLEYGLGLQTIDLNGTKSWEENLEKLKIYGKTHQQGWIIGRGWDQNDWAKKEFPDKAKLDELFPGQPVFLTRVDGHAAIANQKALGTISPRTKLNGGEVATKNGRLTGILIDNAVALVSSKIPPASNNQLKEALLNAQANCFSMGLTTIDDCGLEYDEVKLVESLHNSGDLKMKLYIMLSDNAANFNALFKRGIIKTDRLNVRSFKVYADGALGSRGACLLAQYSDQPGHYGFLLSTQQHFDEVAAKIYQRGFQMCTHAIGDSGNRVMLRVYAKYLKGKNDLRWRIEHAQVVNENDFYLFGSNNIIPSVQPTHATSDMYWAEERLGAQRVKGAYAFQQLLNENGWLPLGTDFPVEDISPFKTFFAACIRKDAKGWPEKGYQISNALSRKQALMGMTIWAAKANFEEHEKGSLEPGKSADFVMLTGDLLEMDEGEILQTQVLKTFINGEMVYKKK